MDIALDADTLSIDAERRIASVVFRGLVPVADAAALGRAVIHVGVEIGGQPVVFEVATPLGDPRTLGGTLGVTDAPASARIPFRASAPITPRGCGAERSTAASRKTGFGATMPMIDAANPDALPFHPLASPKPSAVVDAPRVAPGASRRRRRQRRRRLRPGALRPRRTARRPPRCTRRARPRRR